MLGIPTEGYGFSNNATGFFSAPSFEDAAITVGAGVTRTVISLDYPRSEEHTSELQSLMRISYAVFCLKNKNKNTHTTFAHIKTYQQSLPNTDSIPNDRI